MSVGEGDFHLDLLFYHRHLRRLIALELKLEAFQPAHVGQMEFYLRWLDMHERAPNEESPICLILCASADTEHVELLRLDAKSIRVSEYLTVLPPMSLLQTRLHQPIEHAKEQVLRRRECHVTAGDTAAPCTAERKLKTGTVTDLVTISDTDWHQACRRFNAIQRLAEHPGRLGRRVKEIAKMFGATDRTVRRWLSVYRRNPDIVALLPRQKGQRLGNRRVLHQDMIDV
jgi:YhcG PDDEXK nuclease domain/Helix-turn-helix domain